jgi:hypothetical protein
MIIPSVKDLDLNEARNIARIAAGCLENSKMIVYHLMQELNGLLEGKTKEFQAEFEDRNEKLVKKVMEANKKLIESSTATSLQFELSKKIGRAHV